MVANAVFQHCRMFSFAAYLDKVKALPNLDQQQSLLIH
jgi:hypothetical protein